MVGCRVFGHRYRFRAEGNVMVWECQRGCGAGASKAYGSAAEARHFAAAFDREDRDELGRRAPWFGLLPLRVWYRLRTRSASK